MKIYSYTLLKKLTIPKNEKLFYPKAIIVCSTNFGRKRPDILCTNAYIANFMKTENINSFKNVN